MPMRREVCALSLALALVSKSNGIAASSANTLHPVRAQWCVTDVRRDPGGYMYSKQAALTLGRLVPMLRPKVPEVCELLFKVSPVLSMHMPAA